MYSAENTRQERKVVLIVEDDAALGETLVQLFRELTPHFIFLATDANQAIAVLRSLIPDLLLVDYWLPHMTGLTFYDRLQMVQDLKGIPVLFMSADHSLQELCERHAPFLTKPFDVEDLLQTIASMVGE